MISVIKITDEEEIRSLTVLGDELIEKIVNKECILLGGFAEDYQLITTAVIEVNSSNEVVVSFLYTDEEYRELGHASLMLEEIEKEAKKIGAKGVVIDYFGPKGSYEEISYILGKIDYSEKAAERTLITLKDLSVNAGVVSEDELQEQMKHLKYTKKSIRDFVMEDDTIAQFVSREGITEYDNGQLAFIKDNKIVGVIFFGNKTDKSIRIQGIYINKDESRKNILYAILCLISCLQDAVKKKNVPLEIISSSTRMSDLINNMFHGVESEEDCGLFIKRFV